MKSEETPLGDELDQTTVGTTRRQALARAAGLTSGAVVGSAILVPGSTVAATRRNRPRMSRTSGGIGLRLSHGLVSGGTLPEL